MSPGQWQARVAWLPPFGQGNGLDAPSWAPLADIAPELVDGLLAAFQDVGVPAYAAAVTWPPQRAAGRSRKSAPDHRVWVGAQWYATAEDVLRTQLPRLAAAHDEAGRLEQAAALAERELALQPNAEAAIETCRGDDLATRSTGLADRAHRVIEGYRRLHEELRAMRDRLAAIR